MTRVQILGLAAGSYVQEALGSGHGHRFVHWGRPREVLTVIRHWRTRSGKWCVHFKVRFANSLVFHWTAIEEDRKYKLAPRPSVEELERWTEGAEGSKLSFDYIN